MNETRRLAAFCAGLTLDRLPGEVVQKAKLCILDYIANVYGSLELDAVSRVVSYVRALGGPETATALGCGFKTGIHQAAFLNGVTAEAIEAQDGLRFGGNHSGTAVIPAALAVAEESGPGGQRGHRSGRGRLRGSEPDFRCRPPESHPVRLPAHRHLRHLWGRLRGRPTDGARRRGDD